MRKKKIAITIIALVAILGVLTGGLFLSIISKSYIQTSVTPDSLKAGETLKLETILTQVNYPWACKAFVDEMPTACNGLFDTTDLAPGNHTVTFFAQTGALDQCKVGSNYRYQGEIFKLGPNYTLDYEWFTQRNEITLVSGASGGTWVFTYNIPSTGDKQWCLGRGELNAGPNAHTFTIEINVKETPQKIMPQSGVFEGLISGLIDWLRSIWPFAITGVPTEVAPSQYVTAAIHLTAPVPDSDYADGSYQEQYGGWAVINTQNQVVTSSVFVEVSGDYATTAQFNAPATKGNYALVAIIIKYDRTYDGTTQKWSTPTPSIVAKEGYTFRVESFLAPSPTPVTLPPSGTIWSGIVDTFSGFFNWLRCTFGMC